MEIYRFDKKGESRIRLEWKELRREEAEGLTKAGRSVELRPKSVHYQRVVPHYEEGQPHEFTDRFESKSDKESVLFSLHARVLRNLAREGRTPEDIHGFVWVESGDLIDELTRLRTGYEKSPDEELHIYGADYYLRPGVE